MQIEIKIESPLRQTLSVSHAHASFSKIVYRTFQKIFFYLKLEFQIFMFGIPCTGFSKYMTAFVRMHDELNFIFIYTFF